MESNPDVFAPLLGPLQEQPLEEGKQKEEGGRKEEGVSSKANS
jgi:hypothetical protein